MNKNILIIGTGTIGEPLIGLLTDLKDKLNINVYFHKRTPLKDDMAKVNSLVNRGAILVIDTGKEEIFRSLGHEPILTYKDALELCDVVIDCTPAGNAAKEKYYLPALEKNKNKIFIAQGSEKGFGMPYAYGINDEALENNKNNFIQVVSCNTHNISALIKLIPPTQEDFIKGDFICIRRANDISQKSNFIASPEVGEHKDPNFGTHHARDAYDLFRTMQQFPNIFSSAMKVNSQYMHIIRFNVKVKGNASEKDVIRRFKSNPFTAISHKTLANKIFSFGRDHGYYGRIFNHTVLSTPSLHARCLNGTTDISGFCFTPQDGNSLLSSVAAAMYSIYGKSYKKYMKHFDSYLFKEI